MTAVAVDVATVGPQETRAQTKSSRSSSSDNMRVREAAAAAALAGSSRSKNEIRKPGSGAADASTPQDVPANKHEGRMSRQQLSFPVAHLTENSLVSGHPLLLAQQTSYVAWGSSATCFPRLPDERSIHNAQPPFSVVAHEYGPLEGWISEDPHGTKNRKLTLSWAE